MSCRETSAGSAFTTWARLHENSGLSDVATLSLFHEIRRQYNAMPLDVRPGKTEAEYQALLLRQINRVRANTIINERTRLSLLERLEKARTQPMPDQSIVHALFHITPQVRTRANNLNAFYLDIASRRESTVDEVRQEFTRLSSGVQRGRANRRDYTPRQLDEISHYGVGNEEGVRYAVSTLLEEVSAANATIIETGNKRIIMKPITNPEGQMVCSPEQGIVQPELAKLRLIAAGHDPRNNRLEVRILDTETGLETDYAYTKVDLYDAGEILRGEKNAGKTWSHSIRGSSWHAYDSEEAAALAGIAPRCAGCGQFAAAYHGCPMRVEPKVLRFRGYDEAKWYSHKILFEGSEFKIPLPTATPLREAYKTGAVTLAGISMYVRPNNRRGGSSIQSANIIGSITAYQDSENKLKFNNTALLCSCPGYKTNGTCDHLAIFEKALAGVIPATRVSTARMTPAEKKDFIKNFLKTSREMARTDWSLDKETLKEARSTWIKNAEILYSKDFDTFAKVFEEAVKERKQNKKPSVPYMKENALNGLATRESGQAFGVEIEYTIPRSLNASEVNRRIGQQLLEANLIPSSIQSSYHKAKDNGYLYDTHVDANGRGTWSLERDGSVDGEIVSPRMYDEPETWEKLEKVLTILSANGVKMSTKAGGHVHVGTGFYKGDPSKYTELAKLVTQHEDVLYRLAADPIRGVHRGGQWSRPVTPGAENGFAKIGDVKGSTGRGALNFNYADGGAKDHPEFRIFDGTLDPGAVQAHIKLSVAMTHAAARIAKKGNTHRTRERLGEHYKRNETLSKAKVSSPEILKEDTSTFRSFLDTLFQRKEDKDQMIALFANTRWKESF